MKQVMIEIPPIDVVSIDKVDSDKYYAISNTRLKCPVTMVGYESNKFVALSPNGFTSANGYDFIGVKSSLSEFLNEAINRGWKVYEFDTAKKMYKWLSE